MDRKAYLQYLEQWAQSTYVWRAQVVACDPPWFFRNYAADAPGMIHNRTRGAAKHYPTMLTEDICRLVPPTAPDAGLFMWTTRTHLPDALRVIDAWGFEYKTVAFTWIKPNAGMLGRFVLNILDESIWFMGMGYLSRGNEEFCLYATKGKGLKRAAANVRSPIIAPLGRHSEKPAEFFKRVERLFPSAMYPHRLEMFSREQRPGWKVFGNEVERSVTILPVKLPDPPPPVQAEAEELDPFRSELWNIAKEINGSKGRPASTTAINVRWADRHNCTPRPDSTIRYHLTVLERKGRLRRPTPSGGWLAVA